MTPEIKEAATPAETEKERWEQETLQKVLDKTPETEAAIAARSLADELNWYYKD